MRAPVIGRIGPPTVGDGHSMPMLPWFPAAFMFSTRGWSVVARGIYRELIDTQWGEGSVPADTEVLRKLVGATPAEWKHWPLVEPKFPIGADGRRRNLNLEKIRAKSIKKAERHRLGARKTNTKRWKASVTRLSEEDPHDAS